ncbi:MAG TPA: HNH endonuclease [Rubrobacter sp.]|nr:HNH endonuclease [Rubrobacter sp.]
MTTEGSIRGAGPFGKALDIDGLLGKGTDARRRFERRFWSSVDIGAEDECWTWRGKIERSGYGRLSITVRPYERIYPFAHRVALVLKHGALEQDACVLHTCDNPPCCNPSHLRVGTQTTNILERDLRGRHNPVTGERVGTSVLTEGAVRSMRAAYANGGVSLRELADQHGVTYQTVQAVVHRRTWKEVV